MINRLFLTLFAATMLFSAESADDNNIVRQALDATMRTPDSLFQHHRLTRRNLQQSVEFFNPQNDEHWDLLLVDGKRPDDAEISDFLKRKKSGRGQQRDVKEMLDFSSLTLIERNGSILRYQFRPIFEEARLQNAPIKGELTIVNGERGPWIKSLFMENTEPLSPAPLVKFEAFRMTIEYTEDTQQEYILPARFAMVMKGKALGLKEIDMEFETLYGRFVYRGSPISVPNDKQFEFLD